jgi:hypothetical protein
MAVTALNTSTLSEALTSETNDFTVGSTANVVVGNYLAIQGTGGLEAVKVQEIPVSGRVKVLRGVGGTRARAHKSGARFFIGDPDDFASQAAGAWGAIDGLAAGANDVFPEYLFPGLRAKDGVGNEYVLVDLTANVFSGVTVLISTDGLFTAAPLTTAGQGSVGVMVEPATSNQYAWAQIYGNTTAQDAAGDSAATSAFGCVGATSVSTPDAGMATVTAVSTAEQFWINGMFITGAATTATSSASSHTGVQVPVWLNYPFVHNVRKFVATS